MSDWIVSIGLPLLYLAGLASAVDALLRGRGAQSTTAWILGLSLLPFIALPLYWFFGRRHFTRYAEIMEEFDEEFEDMHKSLTKAAEGKWNAALGEDVDNRTRCEIVALEKLGDTQFTRGNRTSLLVNGEAMYEALFAAIDAAEKYVLVQFYVVRDDDIGMKFQQHLLNARERGVDVSLLLDGIGSISLPDSYTETLTKAGAKVAVFSGSQSSFRQFRLNFRNHRKIAVIDGHTALVGGLNVGDEYLGRDEKIGNWRDTHLELSGPAVVSLQLAFAKDWYFAEREMPAGLRWEPECEKEDAKVLIASSGPHSDIENCGLLFAHLISSAEKRVWIASPYFVPDGRVLGALQLAAMRDVDVRIIVPRSSDNPLFRYVPFAFFEDVVKVGVRIFFYENDFLHEKVVLVDDEYAVVSTANLDNRSFFLNFEVSAVVNDASFCKKVEKMLKDDLKCSTEMTASELETRSLRDQLLTRLTRLFAPLL